MLADQATAVVASGTDTLNIAQGAIAEGQRYIAEDLTAVTASVQETLVALRSELSTMRSDASALMATLGTTGETATLRLQATAEDDYGLSGFDLLAGHRVVVTAGSLEIAHTSAAAAMLTRRITVPTATRRVWPDRMRMPW